MAKYTNISSGSRGLRTIAGALVMVEAGESVEGSFDDVNAEWFSDGEDALAGNTVAELKAIADAEAVDLGDAVKKADIIAAIELAREKGDDE